MELSPDSAASNAFHAAALIRIVAEKPKKEDYSDYKAFRREYKAWHGSWTRCHQEVHDPAKREAEPERDSGWHAFHYYLLGAIIKRLMDKFEAKS